MVNPAPDLTTKMTDELTASIWNISPDLMLARIEGKMSYEALLGQTASQQQNNSTAATQIFDIRALDVVGIASAETGDAAKNWAEFETSHESVVIANSSLTFGLSRAYGSYSESRNRKVTILHNLDELEAYLEMSFIWYKEIYPDVDMS